MKSENNRGDPGLPEPEGPRRPGAVPDEPGARRGKPRNRSCRHTVVG